MQRFVSKQEHEKQLLESNDAVAATLTFCLMVALGITMIILSR